MSDLISNSPPSKLIDCMNKLRLCSSSSKYTKFKNSVAAVSSVSKDEGKIPGLIVDEKGAIHMDNIEKYQKHARTPQNALAQALVIGLQQPILNKSSVNESPDIICLKPREARPSKTFEQKHKQIEKTDPT